MKTFLLSLAASTLAILLIVAVGLGLVTHHFDKKSGIDDHSWLHLDLYGDLPEFDPPAGLLGGVSGGGVQTLQSVLTSLEMVRVDDRIEGVVLQLSASSSLGRAKIEEIRNAVAKVRADGKPVLAYADAVDLRILFAAAACDSFFAPPSAYITFTGLQRRVPHIKTALNKLGIAPELSVIKEYKSAAQIMTRDELTPEAIENTEWLLEEYMDMMVRGLEEDRGIDRAALESLMAGFEFTGAEALEYGVLDRLLYWDELATRFFHEDDDEAPRLVSGSRYAQEDPEDFDLGGESKIAVIHAQGNIGGRKNGVNPFLGLMMGHESINAELERALRDEDVVAIVLRVDSGGGDSLTSDLMGHKVHAVSQEKPVVVSMVDVAASGGYSMSYRASWIVADAMTVTGSIGSISGKFDMSGFNEKVGLDHTRVALGPNAGMMDSDKPFTEEQFALFNADHQRGFHEWIVDVAKYRKMSVEKVESLAMGRVWTGRQALENGLIDELGGLDVAVAAAKRLAGVEEKTKTALWHLPESQDLLSSLLGGDDEALTRAGRWMLRRAVQEDMNQVRQAMVSHRWHRVTAP